WLDGRERIGNAFGIGVFRNLPANGEAPEGLRSRARELESRRRRSRRECDDQREPGAPDNLRSRQSGNLHLPVACKPLGPRGCPTPAGRRKRARHMTDEIPDPAMNRMARLLAVMAALRTPGTGCP